MERRTTKPEYVESLLATLTRLGAVSEDVLFHNAFQYMKNRLYPSDFIMLSNGEPRWRYQMQHMLDGLIENGKIRKKDGLLSLDENLQP
jgi:hypothetical protein